MRRTERKLGLCEKSVSSAHLHARLTTTLTTKGVYSGGRCSLGRLTIVRNRSAWTLSESFHPAFHVGNKVRMRGCLFFRLNGERSRTIPKKWLGPSLSAFARKNAPLSQPAVGTSLADQRTGSTVR